MQDLEIYIRDLEPAAVSNWLEGQLDELQLDDTDVSSVVKGMARYSGARVRITLYPGAFGKRFTSLVMEGVSCPGTATWIAPAVPGGQWILKSAAARETGKKGTRWRTISGGGWIIAASSWWSGTDSHKVFGLKQKSSPERLLFY